MNPHMRHPGFPGQGPPQMMMPQPMMNQHMPQSMGMIGQPMMNTQVVKLCSKRNEKH